MKNRHLIEKIKNVFSMRTLASKIRYFGTLLIVPFLLLDIFGLWALADINSRYETMIDSTLSATRFGLDFKESFDYKTYLLIAGDTPLSKSPLLNELISARTVVNSISMSTDSEENKQRLGYVLKYFSNLETYTNRIENYLREGNKYEECIEVWENDVQIVTTLISDTMSEYIYYEVQEMHKAKEQYQRNFSRMIMGSIVGFGLILVIIVFLSYIIPRSIIKPVTEIAKVTDEVAGGNFSARANSYEGEEVKVLADSVNVMIDKINQLLVQIKDEQLSLRKAEFELLQAQINPHFLYNTLDAIVWLAETGEQEKVVNMVENLSSFFRASLSHGREIVLLQEELSHVTSYLSIQKMRYQDILNYSIELSDDILDCEIPKLTLQPFVENALYHGIKEKRGGGTILVSGWREGENIVLEVSDDGKGMTEKRLSEVRTELEAVEQSERSIYGLYNVNQRIRLNYGTDFGISLSSEEGKGTVARILLPFNKKS